SGRAAAASSSKARLSGPPDTATPIRACFDTRASKSARKRSRIDDSTGPPELVSVPFTSGGWRSPTWLLRPRRFEAVASIALGLRFAVTHLFLKVPAGLGAVNSVELCIDFAGLARLAELHRSLGKVIKAVRRPLAARIATIVRNCEL